MQRCLIVALMVALNLLDPSSAVAHDSWISRGGLQSPAGEWCCGDGDCGVMISGAAKAVAGGYEIDGVFRITFPNSSARADERVHEFWPQSETMPSPDGAFWRCKRPDGSPRCRFAPPPGM